MNRSDIEALPYALVGATIGIYKYYVRQPMRDAVESWIDAHMVNQEEFDKFLGGIAIDLEPPKKE